MELRRRDHSAAGRVPARRWSLHLAHPGTEAGRLIRTRQRASSNALILTYHAVESGHSALCIEPELFRRHLECIGEAGAQVITVRTLAQRLRDREALPEPVVALTFDDGFASVAAVAAPLLAARGMTATVFCVAGHLGGSNDWASGRPGGFRGALASASALRELAAAGFEIGSHGFEHAPLVSNMEDVLHREVVDSKRVLEETAGARVSSFAYPYGAGPSAAARRIVQATYDAACSATIGLVGARSDLYTLRRVDAYYLSNPDRLRRALSGSLEPSLLVRGLGARARRTFRKDYVAATSRSGGATPDDTPQTTREARDVPRQAMKR